MTIEVQLQMHCRYTNELIREVLNEEDDRFTLMTAVTPNATRRLYWLEYEDLDFEQLYGRQKQSEGEQKVLVNSFCIRKGLLRKANFAAFLQRYVSKRPESILRDHYPETHILDLPDPDYLEEALNEAFELRDALENNAKEDVEPVPFILKPSILDKANDILIFRRQAELEQFFNRGEEEEEEDENETVLNVREWIVQRYINNPKLLSTYGNRKFHLRVYVVAQGDLRVHVYDGILALFASLPYTKNEDGCDRLRHITNTCAQTDSPLTEDELVKEFFSLAGMDDQTRTKIFDQIQSTVKAIFSGLHHERTIFQPLRSAFEIYGFDFLVDENDRVYFLEANAFPDFKQTGNALRILIKELFENIVRSIILPYFGEEPPVNRRTQRQLHLVYDQQRGN